MAIDVITGQPRNGKSQYALKLIFDDIKDNDKLEKEGKETRPIFADIAGINAPDTPTKLPDVKPIPTDRPIWFGDYLTAPEEVPDGYWCPPAGSIFYFDECHKIEWVKEVSGTLSKNPTTISLNEHGHIGHDIKLITQFPNYIHTHIRGLTQQHFHVKRVHGSKFAWVYKWDDFQLSPRTKSAITDAFETEKFFFKKKYQDAYQSASAHSKIKFKIPAKLIPFLIIIPLLIFALWYVGKDSMFAPDKEEDQEQTTEQLEQMKAQNQQQLEEINNIRFELEELKAKYLPKHIAIMAEHEDVRPAMIIASSSSCVAYNTYGEPLLISDSLCYMMNESPALIPKSRQAKQVSHLNDNEGITDNPFSNQDNGMNVEYIEPNDRFVTGS
ncbi:MULTISPECIES: zonular occludens toxin domain-containing protein [unclassified Psychrobacter]|uniref:zonular occludens toxin domain-containing protein n=1 Tax=unclassified Psychrobacter TaxID=196806 RepID=UPI0025B5DE46|nr:MULTISPECIES: zonular occludens toxin domain-containing protein [unclassified Psychrobacter]MDN3452261.1 zonular occludens toxin domain-containing protein [Psychrobacter sp. APC 3350]MDN3502122.1 zonular occludens toxin domain-containing protein [Psychrobacter sp. 5A.1]